jgi:pimeloyl-ACP methyl ester carboxylesterase
LSRPDPRSHYYTVSGLRLHYLRWGDAGRPALIFLHGGRDHAHMWDWIAPEFVRSHTVYVPDLRGHGDSDWASASQYAIVDFVTDLAALVEHISGEPDSGGKVSLVGHSRGAGIVLRYAGTFPERVERVVAIDGIGRHTRWEIPAPERLRGWISHRLEADGWTPRIYPTIEAAAEPAMRTNRHLTRDLALELTRLGTRAEAGGFRWKFDPRAHYHPAYDFDDDELCRFFTNIAAPVLFMRGDESHLGIGNVDPWLPHFRDARSVVIPHAGHWVQHDQPAEVLRLLQGFLVDG